MDDEPIPENGGGEGAEGPAEGSPGEDRDDLPPGAVTAGDFLGGAPEQPPEPAPAERAPAVPADSIPAEPISEEEVAADLAAPPPAPSGSAPAPAAAEATEAEAAPREEEKTPPPPPGKTAAEALLFSAETALTASQVAGFLGKGVKAQDVKGWLDELQTEYDETGRAFRLEEIGGGYRLMTRQEYFPYVRNLKAQERSSRLSEAAVDTLAVVAYRQPILKADVNQIRGVESGPILKTLMEKGLIRAVGRADTLGRPVLYGTSKSFLDFFGLKSLKDLPRPEK